MNVAILTMFNGLSSTYSLVNVVSDSGRKEAQDSLIKTTIEGDLPIE